MFKYEVRTRNWEGKFWVWLLLQVVTRLHGGKCWPRINPYSNRDHDSKFCYEGDNERTARALYRIYMKLAPYSGGWTYIEAPEVRENPRALAPNPNEVIL